MLELKEEAAHQVRPSWLSERPDGFDLVGSKNLKTGKCVFPRVPDNSPSASRYAAVELSRHGKIYSFTVIHPNPKTGEKPFTLVYVDFPQAARAFGRLDLATGEAAKIDMDVEVRVEGASDADPRYYFIPAKEHAR